MRKNPQPLTNFGQGAKRYETEKVITSFRGNQYVNSGGHQNDDNQNKIRTNERLAEEYGVGTATIERNARFTKVVDILPEPVKQGVLSGEQKISHEATSSILKFDKPTQKKLLKEVESGAPIKEAVKKL